MRKPNTRRVDKQPPPPLVNDYPLGVTVGELRAWLDEHPDTKELMILVAPTAMRPITQIHFSNFALILSPMGLKLEIVG